VGGADAGRASSAVRTAGTGTRAEAATTCRASAAVRVVPAGHTTAGRRLAVAALARLEAAPLIRLRPNRLSSTSGGARRSSASRWPAAAVVAGPAPRWRAGHPGQRAGRRRGEVRAPALQPAGSGNALAAPVRCSLPAMTSCSASGSLTGRPAPVVARSVQTTEWVCSQASTSAAWRSGGKMG